MRFGPPSSALSVTNIAGKRPSVMLKIASGVAPTDVYAPSQKSGPSLTSRLAAVMPPSPPSADVKVSSDTRDVNVLQEF